VSAPLLAAAAAPPRRRWREGVGALGFLAVVVLLVLGVNLRRGLNHDEHQFVASAALIARNGLLPYRDFPYFHVPVLSFVDALLFQVTDYLLLAARLFSVVCSGLMLALLLGVALTRLDQLRPAQRLLAGALTVLLLMSTPSFVYTSGRAWNHDLPVLLTMLAACMQGGWLVRRGGSLGWLLVSGLLVGLASATRVSFALVVLPFALAPLLVLPWRERRAWAAVALFGVGVAVGLLPAIFTFLLAPQRFFFGNFTYAQLNTAYYQQAGGAVALSLGQKLAWTAEYVVTQPGNLLLVALALVQLWRVRAHLRVRTAPEVIFGLGVAPFLLLGAFAPTPIQPQYLYALFPWLALLFLAALAYDARPRGVLWGAGIATALAMVLAAPRYGEGAAIVFTPAEWYPLKVHARGEQIAHLVGGERVLTFAPIFVLEGKAPVYPEFVTGPLGWRVAPLLSPAARASAGLVGVDELAADLAQRAPRGVLTGVHDNDAGAEAPLLAYAQDHGYVPIALADAAVLWVSPLAAWGERIRLGAADLPGVPVAPGDELVATFYLMATQPVTQNLNVLVRLVAPDGVSELVRSEGWPWGRPTSTWEVGEVWPDGHMLKIPASATPGPYRVELSFYDPATLEVLGDQPATVGYVVVGDSPSAPPSAPLSAPPSAPPTATLGQFGSCIRLSAADVPAAGWQVGATQPVRLTWQRTAPDCGRYTMFVHLVGANGLVAQRDQEPLQGFYPTNAWLLDVPVTEDYALTLPAALAPGAYQLVAGLYDAATGQRLPLLRDGHPAGDTYPLATVMVD